MNADYDDMPSRNELLYHAYTQGWLHGVKWSAMDPCFSGSGKDPEICREYEQGYIDGKHDRAIVSERAAKRLGHTIRYLRLAESAK